MRSTWFPKTKRCLTLTCSRALSSILARCALCFPFILIINCTTKRSPDILRMALYQSSYQSRLQSLPQVIDFVGERLGATGVQLGRKVVIDGQEIFEFIAASAGQEHMIGQVNVFKEPPLFATWPPWPSSRIQPRLSRHSFVGRSLLGGFIRPISRGSCFVGA